MSATTAKRVARARGLPHEARAAVTAPRARPRRHPRSLPRARSSAAFFLSLTDFDIYSLGDAENTRFIGLKNYANLLRDPLLWKAMRNTALFLFVGGPLTMGVGLAAALLVNSKLARAKGVFRTIFFAPDVTTLVAVAVVFRYLYHPRFGLIDRVLALVGIPPIDWLGDPRWAMPAIILLAVWKNFGYSTLLLVAGLQSIPGVPVRSGAHRRRRRRGSSSARSRCRCSRPRSSSSASSRPSATSSSSPSPTS